jgi:hypothetical protein
VIDRFSSSDRFSTTSTASTASEQHPQQPDTSRQELEAGGEFLLDSGIIGLSNPDFLLSRLANSEARTFVESRGDVELVTALVAPNTVVIEETPTLQPPLSFQDAPLSYGHEPRPGIFYSADLAADSKTHFRPIKDDAELVEKVFNGASREAPPLPTRNHVNRIPVNQQEVRPQGPDLPSQMPLLPPKPMPRKELKSKKKRPPPPPPPPPRREPPMPVPEARDLSGLLAKEGSPGGKDWEAVATDDGGGEGFRELGLGVLERRPDEIIASDENANKQMDDPEPEYKTNKVLEIVEMKKAKALLPRNELSRTLECCEVPEGGASPFGAEDDDSPRMSCAIDVVQLKNSINSKLLRGASLASTASTELEDHSSDEGGGVGSKGEGGQVGESAESDDSSKDADFDTPPMKFDIRGRARYEADDVDRFDAESEDDLHFFKVRGTQEGDDDIDGNEEDLTDESDGDDYYWQSNLATIGEEEENNSLEYENAYVAISPFLQ